MHRYLFLLLLSVCLWAQKGESAARVATTTTDNDIVSGANFSSAFSVTNFTYLYPELEDWEVPVDLSRKYPFYLSGFDEENRPIWISEWGKFDIKTIAHAGPERMEVFLNYIRKMVRVVSKSHDFLSTRENPVYHADFLIDLDEFKLEMISDPPTLAFLIRLGVEHRDIILQHAHTVVLLNTNFIADAAVRISRSVFGGLFERVHVFGTNKAQWMPELLRLFPKESLPEWYGGVKDHKPLLIYG